MNLESMEKKIYREHRSCSVVVITLASHARGLRFEPGQEHFYVQKRMSQFKCLWINFSNFCANPYKISTTILIIYQKSFVMR